MLNKNLKIKLLFAAIFIVLEIIIVNVAVYENFAIKNHLIDVNFELMTYFKIAFGSLCIFLAILFMYKTYSSSQKLQRASNGLMAINKNFAGVLNSIHAIIYATDLKNHEIVFANNYAMSKFGEIVGKKCYLAIQYNKNEECAFCFYKLPIEQQKKDKHKSYSYEYFNELTNEWYAVTDKITNWMDGREVKISVCLDITGRKNAEEELRKINEKLGEMVDEAVSEIRAKDRMLIQQSKMAAMGEMIGAIAHQWRQPLNALGLIIQDLKVTFLLNDLNKNNMETITSDAMEQIRFMSKTIDDFRNFFRPDKPKSPFSIKSAVNEVLKISSAGLENNSVSISFDCNDEDLIVDGYENEFKQVVLNLISNAKDAAVENSKAKNTQSIIKISLSKHGSKAILSVLDNGGGIKDNILEKIFEPYFTTKTQGKGTGIGLYMSKMIIEDNMLGKLYAVNEADGAKFLVELQLTDTKEG